MKRSKPYLLYTSIFIMLLAARCFGKKKTVLTQEGQTVLVDDRTLREAAENNDVECIKQLYGAGIDLNKAGTNGVTALLVAVQENNYKTVKYLLENGADPNLQTYNSKWTPLMQAVKLLNYDFVELLLQYGAKKELAEKNGQTAVEIAEELLWKHFLYFNDVKKKSLKKIVNALGGKDLSLYDRVSGKKSQYLRHSKTSK